MTDSYQKIKQPELVFGFVCPIGADMVPAINSFRMYFQRRGYKVVEIKVTDVFNVLQKYFVPESPLDKSTLYKRYVSYIGYGNQIRARFGDPTLASLAIRRVMAKRIKVRGTDEEYSICQVEFDRVEIRQKEITYLTSFIHGRALPESWPRLYTVWPGL